MAGSGKKIICAVDFEHLTLTAERAAYALAKSLGRSLTLLHVDNFFEMPTSSLFYSSVMVPQDLLDKMHNDVTAEKRKMLKTRVEAVKSNGGVEVDAVLSSGNPTLEIERYVDNLGASADMLVLSKRKRSFLSDLFLGSIANDLLKWAGLPILLMPDTEEQLEWQPRNIVLALSMQEKTRATRGYAAKLAQTFDANVHIVHVGERLKPLPSQFETLGMQNVIHSQFDEIVAVHQSNLEKRLRQESADLGVAANKVTTDLRYGSILEELFSKCKEVDCDLLIIGRSNTEPGEARHLGRVAHSLARMSGVPLLVVPSDATNI